MKIPSTKNLKISLSYKFIVKVRNYIYILLVVLTLFFIYIPYVHAVVIIPYEETPIFIILNILGPVVINVFIEFGTVYFFLRSRDLVKKKLFLSVTLVNLVIFPPSHAITYFLMIFYIELLVFFVILFGFLMVSIEWILYHLEFQKLYLKKSIPESLSLKKTIKIATLTNIVSFSVLYLPIVVVMIQQYIFFPSL